MIANGFQPYSHAECRKSGCVVRWCTRCGLGVTRCTLGVDEGLRTDLTTMGTVCQRMVGVGTHLRGAWCVSATHTPLTLHVRETPCGARVRMRWRMRCDPGAGQTSCSLVWGGKQWLYVLSLSFLFNFCFTNLTPRCFLFLCEKNPGPADSLF